MPDPIVIELQRLASNGECPVDQLLRKALLVAAKLGVEDFRKWITFEMNGYPAGTELPDYRRVKGEARVFNPVQGRLVPFYLPENLESLLTQIPVAQPIGILVDLADTPTEVIQWSLPPTLRDALVMGQGRFPMEPVVTVAGVYVTRALDAVRNTILEWSIRLEEQGILGEGMMFSFEEKSKAMTSPNIHIGSFQGILGDVAGSTVSQALTMSVKAGDFNSLKQQLAEAGVSADDLESLKEALDTDPKPTSPSGFGPKVSAWIGTVMTKAASGAWKVTLDTAGKLIPTAIAAYYGLKG